MLRDRTGGLEAPMWEAGQCPLWVISGLQRILVMSALPPKADMVQHNRHVNPVRRKVRRTTAPGQAVSCASFA
jgi:hypothetical protein